jgi:hypothetical protein
MERIRKVEERLVHRYGVEGLSVCRAVLSERQSVEATARARGAESEREIRFWTGLFRKCLDVLAAAFGFAGSTKRPKRPRSTDVDPALDPARCRQPS